MADSEHKTTQEPCPECDEPEHEGPCRNSLIDWWCGLTAEEQDRVIAEELARER
jgi:hypothetical protein